MKNLTGKHKNGARKVSATNISVKGDSPFNIKEDIIENIKADEDQQSLTAKSKRRKRRRPSTPDYLNLEMVFRKSLLDSFKEYLNHCSLAGARQMCDPELGWQERFIWGLVFLTALGTIGYFLQYIWLDTLTKPLIVNMESVTYPISSIDFPAVAICNINRISKRALKIFALEEYEDLATHGETLEEVERVLVNWGRLINFSYNESLRLSHIYRRLVDKYRFEHERVIQIMEAVKVGKSTPAKRQKEPGFLYGLNLILDALTDDYAYPLHAVIGFDVLILDPSHVADPISGRVVHRISEPDTGVFMELKSTKQVATDEVRKYAIATRNCLFHDEGSFDLYTYSTCIMQCRIETVFSLCKCTPYFFTKAMQLGPICTLENIRCLNKYKEKLNYLFPKDVDDTRGLEVEMKDSMSCPQCLPDCELTQYVTKSYEIPLSSPYEIKQHRTIFLGNIDPTNKTFLSIYHPLPDANLNRLDVVFYWYEILSNIGGFCGIVVGFSFMAVVELFYFLSIRLIANIYNNYKKYHA